MMKSATIISSVCLATIFAFAPTTLAETTQKKNETAQKKKSQKQRNKTRNKTGRRKPLTPQQESAALEFAQKHHPELAELLMKLKKNRKNQYQRAVRQLFTTSDRIGRIKERSPERFKQQLQTWKLDSRIRLLMARNSMGGNSELEKQIRELVTEKINLRVEQLKVEQQRAKIRLERVEKQLNLLESDPEAAIEREINRFKKTLGKRKIRNRKKKKNSEK